MVNGITFSEQLITSENFAHFMYTFLNHANGVTKGCAISNANGKVYVQKGYFIVFGRMVQIIGTEEIASPDVVSGQLYCKVVFEVDLSKENTAEEFIQGAFKTLTSTTGYPSVKQEDLDDAGKVYQMPWCQYVKQAGSIKDFRDLREILDLNSIWSAISNQNTQYKGEFDDYFAAQRSTILGMIKELEGHGYATTAEFNSLSSEVAETKKSVSDGKALVAAAITAKRVATAATDTFAKMAENIKKIVLGSGNAQPADVLAGKTATNDSGVEFTGTMPNRGWNAGDAISIANSNSVANKMYAKFPAGAYFDESAGSPGGAVYLPYNTLASAIGLNPDYMIDTYTVLGKKGKIPTIEGVNITPQTYKQTVNCAWKRLSGNVEIAAVPLPPANVIKKGYRYWIGSNYVDGTYVYSDITGYYYQAPNEMTGVTGGWNWILPSDQKPNPGTLSRQQGYMDIKMNPGSWEGGTSSGSNTVVAFLCTTYKINITNIRTIYLPIIEGSTGSYTTYFGIANEQPGSKSWNNFVSRVLGDPVAGKQFVLDVSNITGSYYLIVMATAFYGSNTGIKGNHTRFSEIRYETMER